MKLFQYYEIRACVRTGDQVESFLGKPQPHPEEPYDTTPSVFTPEAALAEAKEHGDDVFWTLYGMAGADTLAIGDFVSFEAAYEVLLAMLVPFRRAIDAEDWSIVEDILNQSTNEDRL